MQRDITPDVLRGFALLGILVVNIQFMGLSSAEGARGEWALGLVNGSATFIIASIFTGKFYLLFPSSLVIALITLLEVSAQTELDG